MDEAQLRVLQMVEQGIISPEEGERLLAAMTGGAEPADEPGEPTPAEELPVEEPGEPAPAGPPLWWQRVWLYPLLAGVTLLAGMAYLTDRLLDSGEKLGWLLCTIPLMGLGALIALLAWWSTQSRWLHLRIRDEDKQIKISLPLPLRPTAWLLRLARPWVPQLRDTAVDELILALEDVKGPAGALVVQVDEGEGEQVQIYFG